MSNPRVGINLIVFGEKLENDIAGVFGEVAEAGYEAVEAPNLFEKHGQSRVKELLSQTKVGVITAHVGYDDLAKEGRVGTHMAYLKSVGGQYLICSGVSDMNSLQGFEDSAEFFNEVGRRCKEAGLTFCYHNHNWEFKAWDGVKGIHRLNELCDPNLVKLCTDVYWVHIGGEDPAEYIDRYKDRAGYYHFKDGSPGKFVELGQGEVDLISARDAALKAGADWIICEQDKTDKATRQSIRESREYLRSMGL
ncbi:MAG: sugar phosphate isomerase/epimerase [bacterium]